MLHPTNAGAAVDAVTTPEVRVLHPGAEGVLARVAPDVFDHDVDPAFGAEFLADGRHHVAVAIDDGLIVGFARGVHYCTRTSRPSCR